MGSSRSAARFLAIALAIASATAACNAIVGNSEGYLRDDDGGAGSEAGSGGDDGGGASSDGALPSDGSTSIDSGSTGDGSGGANDSGNPWGSAPLDPKLSLPDPSGAPCTSYGDILACPTHDQTCRIASPTAGRCELYSTTGATGYSCATSRDCDAFLECYAGLCTPFCDLDGGSNCYGRPCLYVGNGGIGVCDP